MIDALLHPPVTFTSQATVKIWRLDDIAYAATLFGHQAEVYVPVSFSLPV
jgi:hypothetical protein